MFFRVLILGLFLAVSALPCGTNLAGAARDFEEVSRWPVLGDKPADRRTLVLVGSRMFEPKVYRSVFSGPSEHNQNQRDFPSVPHLVLDVSGYRSAEELVAKLNELAPEYPVVIFATHSNERVAEIAGSVVLGVSHLAGLKLAGNVLIFTECNVGGTKLPETERLMDRVMTDTKARAAMGMRRISRRSEITMSLGEEFTRRRLPDFLTPVWHVVFSGGTYGTPGYRTFDDLDPDAAFEAEMRALGMDPADLRWQMPKMPQIDPLKEWRILERRNRL